jgi:hypothetical protein
VQTNHRNILVLTYWPYQDALVQTYTLPYVRIISEIIPDDSKIFLLTLDKNNKTEIYNEEKINHISISYKRFGFTGVIMWIKVLFQLIRLVKKENIDTIHAWCTPAGMMGFILSILTGTKLIIDSYEPHAEAMVENGTWKKNSLPFRILFYFEKLQTKRATYLIATTEGMIDYAKSKYNHHKENFYIKPACVDLNAFSLRNVKNSELLKKLKLEKTIVCVYAGKFGGIYLEKEVFDFFKIAENYWGDKFRALILSSHSEEEINQLITASKLDKKTIVHRFVKHSEIPNYIGLGDFAITPVKPVPTKRFCSPIKDGEYWALGLPIVITNNISDDTNIIESNNIGSILKEFNSESYKKSILEIEQLLQQESKQLLSEKIRSIAIKYRNFEIAKSIYKKIYF